MIQSSGSQTFLSKPPLTLNWSSGAPPTPQYWIVKPENVGYVYQRYHRDHDDGWCNGNPGVWTELPCMTAVTLSMASKKLSWDSRGVRNPSMKTGYLFQVAYFCTKKIWNPWMVKIPQKHTHKKKYIYLKKTCSQHPSMLCKRPPWGGTAPVEKPWFRGILDISHRISCDIYLRGPIQASAHNPFD